VQKNSSKRTGQAKENFLGEKQFELAYKPWVEVFLEEVTKTRLKRYIRSCSPHRRRSKKHGYTHHDDSNQNTDNSKYL
jgi:hypothetical protein